MIHMEIIRMELEKVNKTKLIRGDLSLGDL